MNSHALVGKGEPHLIKTTVRWTCCLSLFISFLVTTFHNLIKTLFLEKILVKRET